MVVAPTSTFDWTLPSGDAVPIEMRDPAELLPSHYQDMACPPVAWNPVFDITPAAMIDALVTEKGVVMNPDPSKMTAFKNKLDD
jgi:methylthioribose-1-phosphate isomerase